MVRTTLVATQLFKSSILGGKRKLSVYFKLICFELLFALFCNFWDIFGQYLNSIYNVAVKVA